MNADKMEEILEFFKEEHKADLEVTKVKMYRCFQEYRERVVKAYEVKINDLALEQKSEPELNNTIGEFENEFDAICDDVLNAVLSEYDNLIDIDISDKDITITAFTSYFTVTCQMSVCEAKSKLPDLFFNVELNNTSLFLINLCNKLISMAED